VVRKSTHSQDELDSESYRALIGKGPCTAKYHNKPQLKQSFSPTKLGSSYDDWSLLRTSLNHFFQHHSCRQDGVIRVYTSTTIRSISPGLSRSRKDTLRRLLSPKSTLLWVFCTTVTKPSITRCRHGHQKPC